MSKNRMTFQECEQYRNRSKLYACYRCTLAIRTPVEITGDDLPYDTEDIYMVKDMEYACKDNIHTHVMYCCPVGNKNEISTCDHCIHATEHLFTVRPETYRSEKKVSRSMVVKHALYKCKFDDPGTYHRGYSTCENFKSKELEPNGKKNK